MIDVRSDRIIDSALKELICVTEPYFALKNLSTLDDEILHAEFEVENLLTEEETIISASEAGRHLAIVGLMALALKNDVKSKHYYLATNAKMRVTDRREDICFSNDRHGMQLVAEAKVVQLDLCKKMGKVESNVYTKMGNLIFAVEISYQILKEELFQKLFQRNFIAQTDISNIQNPYSKNNTFANLKYKNLVLTGDIGTVQPDQCVGHFNNYPALPIAILASAMISLAGTHLKMMYGLTHVKYTVLKADLSAYRLAFSGEEVRFKSMLIESVNNEYQFIVEAKNAMNAMFAEIGLFLDFKLSEQT